MNLTKFWQSVRPVRKVGKLRGIIDIPVFDVSLLTPKGSLNVLPVLGVVPPGAVATGAALGITDNLTVEFWLKVYTQNVAGVIYSNAGSGNFPFLVGISNSSDNLNILLQTVTFDIYHTTQIPINEWVHVAFTIDGSAGFLKVYINGEFDSLTVIAAPLRFPATSVECRTVGTLAPYFLAEIRIWSVALDADTIKYYSSRVVSVTSPHLVAYWKCNDASSNGTCVDSGPHHYNMALTTYTIGSADYPLSDALKLGISYVVGEFAIDTNGKAFSLKYPIVKPYTDVNFMPVLRWTNDDDTVTRYKFWMVEGVDMTPLPATYSGQSIPDGAVIEIWNVDGDVSCELTQVIQLETSILNVVADALTTTRTASATLASPINSTLFSDLPSALPMVFDQPLTI